MGWQPRRGARAGGEKLIDGPGARPYIKRWDGPRIIFNHEYRARAGKIHPTENQKPLVSLPSRFAVVAPFLKPEASQNKDWGADNWEKVIKDFPVPVLQLCEKENSPVIKGARPILTESFRHAFWIILPRRAGIVQ